MADKLTTSERILDVLEFSVYELSTAEIAGRAKVSTNAARKALLRLLSDGKVVRHGTGTPSDPYAWDLDYHLPSEQESEEPEPQEPEEPEEPESEPEQPGPRKTIKENLYWLMESIKGEARPWWPVPVMKQFFGHYPETQIFKALFELARQGHVEHKLDPASDGHPEDRYVFRLTESALNNPPLDDLKNVTPRVNPPKFFREDDVVELLEGIKTEIREALESPTPRDLTDELIGHVYGDLSVRLTATGFKFLLDAATRNYVWTTDEGKQTDA